MESAQYVSPSLSDLCQMMTDLTQEEKEAILEVMERDIKFKTESLDCPRNRRDPKRGKVRPRSAPPTEFKVRPDPRKTQTPEVSTRPKSQPETFQKTWFESELVDPEAPGLKSKEFNDSRVIKSRKRSDDLDSTTSASSTSTTVKRKNSAIVDLVPSEWIAGHSAPPFQNPGPDQVSFQEDFTKELEKLTDAERNKIFEVMRRDTIVQLYTELKVSRLRSELAMLKKKGAIRVAHNQNGTQKYPMPGTASFAWWDGVSTNSSSRHCGRCRSELGFIINRGAFCKICKTRVCKSCREYNIKGTDWICNVCHKTLRRKSSTSSSSSSSSLENAVSLPLVLTSEMSSNGSVDHDEEFDPVFLHETRRVSIPSSASVSMSARSTRSERPIGCEHRPEARRKYATISYRTKRTTRSGLIFFGKSKTSVDCGTINKFPNGEIQVATGEWANTSKVPGFHPNMPLLKASKNAKVIIPPAMAMNSKQPQQSDVITSKRNNVKRAWTISNPSGTQGPQMRPRSVHQVNGGHHSRLNDFDPDLKAFAKDQVPPPPKIAPPVFLSVPPPPTTAPPPIPVPNGNQVMSMNGRPIHVHATAHRNLPLRSQSMSQADSSARMNHIQKYRGQQMVRNGSEFMPQPTSNGVSSRIMSSGDVTDNNYNNALTAGYFNSLDRGNRRRQLPEAPLNNNQSVGVVNSKSLPRPPKSKLVREQSDSRSRERQNQEVIKRSQSHGDEECRRHPPPSKSRSSSSGNEKSNNTKKSNNVPLREPTPDYDSSSVSELRVSSKSKPNVETIAEEETKDDRANKDFQDNPNGSIQDSDPKTSESCEKFGDIVPIVEEEQRSPCNSGKPDYEAIGKARKDSIRYKTKSKTEISSTSRSKGQEVSKAVKADDFKLVFISSESSSKDSSVHNSSFDTSRDNDIDEWTTSSPKLMKPSTAKKPSLPPKSRITTKTKMLMVMEDQLYSDDNEIPRPGLSSSSLASTIKTAATRDRNSPARMSPRTPKVHNIPIHMTSGSSTSSLSEPTLSHRYRPVSRLRDVPVSEVLVSEQNHYHDHPLFRTVVSKKTSIADRSLGDELSVADHAAALDRNHDVYRSILFAEIDTNGPLSKALSESDLSELCPPGDVAIGNDFLDAAPSSDERCWIKKKDSTYDAATDDGEFSSSAVSSGESARTLRQQQQQQQQQRRLQQLTNSDQDLLPCNSNSPPKPVLPGNAEREAGSKQQQQQQLVGGCHGVKKKSKSSLAVVSKKIRKQDPECRALLTESFVDEGFSSSSHVSSSTDKSSTVRRSTSSVHTQSTKVSKPVRRSKSNVNKTSINHGGPVTFVSVNNSHSNSSEDDIQGYNTLPRAGVRRKPRSNDSTDDSEIVITRRMSSEGSSNSVRIKIGGLTNSSVSDTSGSVKTLPVRRQTYNNKNPSHPKRKYTLEELEVEGFHPSTDESEIHRDDEEEEDLVDLNSLIEGAVDDEDEQEDNSSTVYGMSSDKMSHASTTSTRRSSQIQRVDDDPSSDESEQELLSLAVNQGSLLSGSGVANNTHLPEERPPKLPPKKRIMNTLMGPSAKKSSLSPERRLLPEKPIKMMFNGIGTDVASVKDSSRFASNTTTECSDDLDSVVSTTSASYTLNNQTNSEMEEEEEVGKARAHATTYAGELQSTSKKDSSVSREKSGDKELVSTSDQEDTNKPRSSVLSLIARFESNPKKSVKLESSKNADAQKEEPKEVNEAVNYSLGQDNLGEKDKEAEGDENLPLGAEAFNPELVDLDLEGLDEDMARAIRAQRGYTSYVFISSSNNDGSDLNKDPETSSVISNASSARSNKSANRVVVNVKESGANCVVLQDGRASNISIVSTESSELGSPNSPTENIVDESEPMSIIQPPAPDIPAKIRTRNGAVMDLATHFGPPPSQEFSRGRLRGGDAESPPDNDNDNLLAPVESNLSNYFTSAFDNASSPNSLGNSRRGRPPVIRAADRAARSRHNLQQQHLQPELREEGFLDEFDNDEYDANGFHITEMDDDHFEEDEDGMYSDVVTYEDHHRFRYQDEDGNEYDVRYDEYDEEEAFQHEYPMCQPVYDDSGDEYNSDVDGFSDEFFDREEELRGYNNRQIDFTLHTIIEESCEDSESEPRSLNDEDIGNRGSGQYQGNRSKRMSDPSELEKYFFYGVGGGQKDEGEEEVSDDLVDENDEDENVFSQELHPETNPTSLDFMSQRNTDDSGSVGSESDGRRTPPDSAKKKKIMRSKNNRSGESDNDEIHRNLEVSYSSGSSSSDERSSGTENSLKRGKFGNKNRKSGSDSDSRRPSLTVDLTKLDESKQDSVATLSKEPSETSSSGLNLKNGSESKTSGSPTMLVVNGPVRKHKSRDSGFVGSTDDLLRNNEVTLTSNSDSQSLSDGENEQRLHLLKQKQTRLEKVSEVSETCTTEDDAEQKASPSASSTSSPCKKKTIDGGQELARKDSFNNWSSDEDTNVMMNRMRVFFRGLIKNAQDGNNDSSSSTAARKNEDKNPQLVALEERLAKLMRTVPGINEDQVKEIVEYLSSEEAWSDSYDSSDCYTSSDLEGGAAAAGLHFDQEPNIPELDSNLNLKPSVASDDLERETVFMYEQLMARMQSARAQEAQEEQSSKITRDMMHQISSRLVALMHESEAESGSQSSNDKITFLSVDSPKVAIDTTSESKQLSKNASKSVEVLDSERSQAISQRLDEQKVAMMSTSTDHDVWSEQNDVVRRGSLGTVRTLDSSSSSVVNDDERWSWKGSFESTLAGSVRSLSSSNNNNGGKQPIEKPPRASKLAKVVQPVDSDSEEDRKSNAALGGTLPRECTSANSSIRSSNSSRHSTNSLPRMGTSAIKKSKAVTTATITLTNVHAAKPNIATNTSASGPKSARFKPPGYKPPSMSRKISPAPGIPQNVAQTSQSMRKTNSEGIIGRFSDDLVHDLHSKSGSESPVILRDFRESSVTSRTSIDSSSHDFDLDQHRDDRHPSPFNKHGSQSSLGSRSESMASVNSHDGGRYGTVLVQGEVQVGMAYNSDSSCLEIYIKQCKDLAAVDTKRNRSDPYVKVYLLPDRSKSGKRKTKVKKHTINPIFDEVLKYPLTMVEAEKRTMWLTVWHSDMFGRNDFLGEVMIPLKDRLTGHSRLAWYALQERNEATGDDVHLNYRGDLIVALKFVPGAPESTSGSYESLNPRTAKGSLMVMVKEAKNLPYLKGSASLDTFCKCCLLPERNKTSKRKTTIVRRSNNPKWEQTMHWHGISLAALSDQSLEVSIWSYDKFAQNELIGGARLNLGNVHQAKPCLWMDSTGRELTLWQQMLDRPNFWVEGSVPIRHPDYMSTTPPEM